MERKFIVEKAFARPAQRRSGPQDSPLIHEPGSKWTGTARGELHPILNWKRRIQPLADKSIFYKSCFKKFPCAWPRVRRSALSDSRLCPIDHKARHSVEEFPKDLLSLCRQRSFPNSPIHQAHPSVAGSLIYMERRMPRAEPWMASLFDVSLRPSEPAHQEISEALLGTRKIRSRVHRPQKIILRYLSIEGGDQACETFGANHRINFDFLHFLSSPYRNVPLLVLHEGVEHTRRIFDLGIGPLQFADDPVDDPEGRPCLSILEGEFAPENWQRSRIMRTHPTFGLSSHSDLELLIGQPSDSRRADPFSENLPNQ